MMSAAALVIGLTGWPFSSKAVHLGDDHAVADRHRLGLDEHVGEVLDRADAARDPAGVADERDRLVPEAEREPHGVDRVLQAAGDGMVVLRVTMTYASADLIFAFHAFTSGSE